MEYRRFKKCGGCYFFTVVIEDRSSNLLTDEVDKLKHSIITMKNRYKFKIDALVIMPDHLHAIFTLNINDNDFSKIWKSIKSHFSKQIVKNEQINKSRKSKKERGIWQRRFWEHLIRDQEDYNQHVNYIHYNPVKHGYVENAKQWRYSTIHR